LTLQAIVLAGGLGTRLRPAVGELPKVLAPVAGRPFREHVLARLRSHGFERVVLAVGYRSDVVRRAIGESFDDLTLAYSTEDEPLGTGGAIVKALSVARPGPCFVLNGDTWIELDYPAMLRRHVEGGASITMATRAMEDVGRYGAIEVCDGRVVRFAEKGDTGPGVINAGVYVIENPLPPGLVPASPFSFERDLLAPRAAAIRPLAFPVEGRFIDIGIPEDLARAQGMFAARGPA
jgi:D-glycero-alpha-D-manno-heptose 1-phosphate guanylyltransferase